jgi:hypothetical protein
VAAVAVPFDEELELGDRVKQNNKQSVVKFLQSLLAIQKILNAVFDQMGHRYRHRNCCRQKGVPVDQVLLRIN